jgi:hypothetical protein
MSNKIVWIASYPKSGNTWVRYLLANLLHGPIISSRQVEQVVPDINKTSTHYNVLPFGEIFFLKTHWKYEKILSTNYETAGAIYIFRNPLDIIASHVNYFMLAKNPKERNNFVDQFIRSEGFPRWETLGFGTWTENVEGWVFQKKTFPCIALKYENMIADCSDAVLRLCEFLRLNKNESEIKKAIELSSFINLRSMEESEVLSGSDGIFKYEHEHKKAAQFRFMHKGKTGKFRKLLSKVQIEKAIDKFGYTMKKLGYSTKKDGL